MSKRTRQESATIREGLSEASRQALARASEELPTQGQKMMSQGLVLRNQLIPGRAFQDLDTDEVLFVAATESRTTKYPDRRLRFLGDAVMNTMGFESDPNRIRLVRAVVG